MPYVSSTGDTYHDRRTCRRLHATGGRIRQADAGDRDACEHCVDDPGVTVEEVEAIADEIIADRLDEGRCPWCDEYDGDHVGQHAASAHPEAWADHQEATQ